MHIHTATGILHLVEAFGHSQRARQAAQKLSKVLPSLAKQGEIDGWAFASFWRLRSKSAANREKSGLAGSDFPDERSIEHKAETSTQSCGGTHQSTPYV